MTVVVDANFSPVQLLPLLYLPAAIQRMPAWQEELPGIQVLGSWGYEEVTG